MNKRPTRIADIRYYENQERTEYGSFSVDPLGTLYSIPFRSFCAIGDRFACKLREHGFSLPGFDHVYIILTPALPSGDVELSTLKLDARIRYVNVGLSPDEWELLDDDGKHDHIVDLTFLALTAFAGDADALTRVTVDLKRYRSQLEVIAKTKETAAYRVDVSFQIRPRQEQSIAFVSYFDKQTGQNGRITLTQLHSADDVYPLCGSIIVRDNTITIKPRSSSRAAIITKKYNPPLSVPVDTVLHNESAESQPTVKACDPSSVG